MAYGILQTNKSGLWTLVLIQTILLFAQASADAPTWDEVGHLGAGILTWYSGSFSLYRVNPPLVRSWATLPVVLFCHCPDLGSTSYWADRSPGIRMEFSEGAYVAARLHSGYFRILRVARFSCIPLALLGSVICYLWAQELWGKTAALVCSALWSFSPTILAYGHLITPDLGVTSTTVLAFFLFRRWLCRPIWARALLCGFALGLAELSKMTAIVYVILLPVIWFGWHWGRAPKGLTPTMRKQAQQLVVIFAVALLVLNTGYGFTGSFKPLAKYQFVSELFRGNIGRRVKGPFLAGNRFADSILGTIPVPVPEDYLLGVDLQRLDFEKHQWSYLNGEWRLGGWWYYYLYAMGVKEPIGLWLLLMFAIVAAARYSHYRALLGEELLLLLPAAAIIGLVSSQTGFNHHVRYVLPAFPFIFISVSRVAKSFELKNRTLATVTAIAAGWFVFSSARVLPHSLSYFNELAGGPYRGHWHLSNSNADWGQDLLYLKRWTDAHPSVTPLHLAYDLPLIDPSLAGVKSEPVPTDARFQTASAGDDTPLGPQPGWFVVSVNKLHDREHRFDYFNDLSPVDWVGYTMPVYHVSLSDANRLRRRYKLPQLSAVDAARAEAKLQFGR